MKILAYAVRPDELSSFKKYTSILNHEVTLITENFGPETAEKAKGYEAVSILGNCKATGEAIEKIAALGIKYLASRSAGINNIDMDTAKKFGVRVTNVPAYSPNAVAEFAVTGALCLVRNMKQIIRRVEVQNFSLNGLLGTEIRNKTIGVVGTGRIGLTAIKAFAGFGPKLIGYDLYQNEEAKKYIQYRSLDELYAEADIISLHCPLLKDNHHMINAQSIAKMKDGVLLVNTSRGGLVDTSAVIAGLKTGKIGGFAMDVYEEEVGIVHTDHTNDILTDDNLVRLMKFNNVLVTPHCAFYTDEAVANMVEYSLQNLKDFETTNKCKNEIL